MSAPHDPRWWRRGRDEALVRARAAQGEAALALLELDGSQRRTASHLEFLAELDGGRVADRVHDAWRPIDAAADAAVAAYLDTQERFPVEDDLEQLPAEQAVPAFARCSDRMRAAQRDVLAVPDRFAREFATLSAALDELGRLGAQAAQAVREASEAVDQATGQGWRVDPAPLARAQVLLLATQEGAAQHGLDGALKTCRDCLAAAELAGRTALDLPAQAERIRHRVAALRTRLEAVEGRASRPQDEVLSALRRRYVSSSWQDVERVEGQVEQTLDRSRGHLGEAVDASAPSRQEWPTALAALGAAKAALDEAEVGVDGARERLALLETTEKDPATPLAHTRFLLRDAQKLVLAGPAGPPFPARLDALSRRLDTAEHQLDHPHPDLLAYLRELAAVEDAVRRVVADVREQRARS